MCLMTINQCKRPIIDRPLVLPTLVYFYLIAAPVQDRFALYPGLPDNSRCGVATSAPFKSTSALCVLEEFFPRLSLKLRYLPVAVKTVYVTACVTVRAQDGVADRSSRQFLHPERTH